MVSEFTPGHPELIDLCHRVITQRDKFIKCVYPQAARELISQLQYAYLMFKQKHYFRLLTSSYSDIALFLLSTMVLIHRKFSLPYRIGKPMDGSISTRKMWCSSTANLGIDCESINRWHFHKEGYLCLALAEHLMSVQRSYPCEKCSNTPKPKEGRRSGAHSLLLERRKQFKRGI